MGAAAVRIRRLARVSSRSPRAAPARKPRQPHVLHDPAMSNEPNKIIYSMIGVSKSYEKKVVLKDIYLSYFYGAKIGVLGLNGSGKSSLLRILASVDTKYDG